MLLKPYIAVLIQWMIWSLFTIAEWLSSKDHLTSKIILFIVFFIIAYFITIKLLKSIRLTIIVTFLSLISYSVIQMLIYFSIS